MPKLDTLLIHAGQQSIDGAVITPIFQSATHEMGDETDYGALRYLRLNNTPNVDKKFKGCLPAGLSV